jgi:hypothetical protein
MVTALDGWGVPNHVRFSFGTPEENEAFVVALRDVLNWQPNSLSLLSFCQILFSQTTGRRVSTTHKKRIFLRH